MHNLSKQSRWMQLLLSVLYKVVKKQQQKRATQRNQKKKFKCEY